MFGRSIESLKLNFKRSCGFVKHSSPYQISLTGCGLTNIAILFQTSAANVTSCHHEHLEILRLSRKVFNLHKMIYSTKSDNAQGKNSSGADKISESPSESTIISEDPSLSATARFKEAVIKAIPRKKDKVKPEGEILSRERNFLTAIRAMSEFLLSPSDLENLRKTKRRSPHENQSPLTVYWRKDVEAKAIEVWGSLENLHFERQKRNKQMQEYEEHLLNLKRILDSYAKDHDSSSAKEELEKQKEIKVEATDAADKVVWAAVIINGVNFIFKLGAWSYTGSHCLFAESLHSLADVTNQLILAYGIHKSRQQADMDHPYGYTTMRYVSSLISGAMIFCIGSGLSFYHGISGLMNPSEMSSFFWAFYVLGGSLITEGGTLLMAMLAIRKGARSRNVSFVDYVLRGSDPSVNVVLLEDMAAVIGVGVALTCMSLTTLTGSHIYDAAGSCIIGGLLAGVSAFIVYTNSAALVGRSIPYKDIEKMNNHLESDVMIRAIHDVKGIDMGSGYVRYKAEVDFDGRELTKKYLGKKDVNELLKAMQKLSTGEEAETFLLNHGESIVDSLGAEVDRIEKKLRIHHPEVRHCDLELL